MSFLNGLQSRLERGGGLGHQGLRVTLARGSIETTSKVVWPITGPDPWTLLLPLHPTLDVASHVFLPRSEGDVLQDQVHCITEAIRSAMERASSLFSTSAVLDTKAHSNAD